MFVSVRLFTVLSTPRCMVLLVRCSLFGDSIWLLLMMMVPKHALFSVRLPVPTVLMLVRW